MNLILFVAEEEEEEALAFLTNAGPIVPDLLWPIFTSYLMLPCSVFSFDANL